MKTIRVPKVNSTRNLLFNLNACNEATQWLGRKSARTAWRTCERGDWMLWLAVRVDIDRKALVLAACECARLTLVHVPKKEKRPLARSSSLSDGLAATRRLR